ncbi:uncharacterized protein LOC107361727 [Tetranychus urticae]|nr:uncharacterized protein LOC107361727 [Tetranychus urticae]
MISHPYYLINPILTMKSKSYNFLLFIIFILASSPIIVSIENGTSDMVVTSAWKRMLGENRPPTDDDYLYVIGPNACMNIVYKNPPQPNCDTTGIEISFMYWANWNKTKFSVVKEGTELFRLAVMPCHRSMPATKFILFDDFDPSTWNYAVYTAARNNEFNFKCDKRVDIEVCDNEDYQDKIEPTDNYLVAIKDINLKYICVSKNAQSLLSNESCSSDTESPVRCVDATCTKDNCPSTFTIKGGFWSSERIPERSEKFGDFWYTDETHETASIILSEKDDMMACVDLAYWITGKSSIRVDIGAITLDFDTTLETESNKYKWKTITLCPRWFAQGQEHQGANESEITLTSNIFNKDDLVAFSLEYLGLRRQSQYRTVNNFLHHFSRPEAKGEWTIVPSFLDTYADNSTNFFIELTFPGQKDGNSYIFSKWFKYSPGLRFRGVLNAQQLFGAFSVTLSLHESNGHVVFSRNLLKIDDDSPDEMRSFKHLNVKFESFATNALKKSTFCYILIKVTYNSTQESKLILNEADVGDGCREGELNCMGHGTCINLEPDQYKCDCNRGWTGYHCEAINFCQTVDPFTGFTGDQFCSQGEGTCNPMAYSPDSYTCECEIMRYWNLNKSYSMDKSKLIQIKGNCEPVSKCVGMIGICPHGYSCDEDTWSLERPCQVCNQDLGFTMYEGKCVKMDACYKRCGTAKCFPFGTNYYCYCDNNHVYDENKQSCVFPEGCSPWIAQKLGCSHYCTVPNGVPSCACHSGYKFVASDGSCKPLFNCTISCPEGSVCVLDSNNMSTCVCSSGWEWDEGTGKCVDICKLADNGNRKWLKYVHDTCGGTSRCSLINSRLTCICNPPTVRTMDGLCELEKICFPGNRGFVECNTRNALCEPRSDGHTFSYRCLCPPGKTFVDGFCIDKCRKMKSECESMNAVCRLIDETEGSHVATCVCRPGFVMKSGYCYLAQHAIKATFLVKISDSKLHRFDTSADTLVETFCNKVDSKFLRDCNIYTRAVINQWFQTEHESFMDRIVARYVDSILAPNVKKFANQMIDSVTLMSYEKVKKKEKRDTNIATPSYSLTMPAKHDSRAVGDFKITVSLQLKSKFIGFSPMLAMFCYDVFSPNDTRYDYCMIPSKTLVRKGTFEESDLRPCKERSIDYCPKQSACLPDHDETKYKCVCDPGFTSQTAMKLDMEDPSLTKHYCVDVDECFAGETLCQGHSTCVNTIGSYNCVCDDNYIDVLGKCTELCEFQACQHGECVIAANQSAFCRCDPWYTGDKCEKINKVAVFWRTMTIVVASCLTSIIVIFIVTSIIVARRSKSHAVENGYLKNRIELTDSMYMQHIRPTMRNLRHQPISTNFDLQT